MSAIIQPISQVTDYQKDADNLLTRLLSYVKECQRKYGGKTELATEYDSCVAGLCCSLELVFLHGLRTKPQETNQQNFTLRQMSDIVSNSLNFNSESPAFWPFVKHHLTKHEQERYAVLRHVWTDYGRGRAWIRSALNERSLERYLHSLFSNPELLSRYYEDWALLCDEEKNSMLPNMAAGLGSILFAISIDKPELNNGDSSKVLNQNEPIINVLENSAVSTDVKKKKRIAPQIISFDDDEIDSHSTSDSINIPSSSASIESIECKGSIESGSEVTEIQKQTGSNQEPTNVQNKPNDNTASRKLSTDRRQMKDITLTPVQQSEVGELKIVPTSHDKFNIDSPLDETIEVSMDIAAVLQSVEKNQEEYNYLQEKITSLTKDNEHLRQQLKNYVSAVQMLNIDSNTAHKALANLSLNQDSQDVEPNYLVEAKFYETKLVQVAEMHGELMEFNEHLQKMLNQKELTIQRLRKELYETKGSSGYDINLDNDSFESVGLTSICVPSAFLTGSGSEAHHVYQVYIRAGNDDWNIYRRYAQFYALHSDLKKLDSVVTTFDFPPKKSIGKKDANLVEDRRKRLQTYLRRIFAHWPELSNCNSRYLLEQHLSFFRDEPNQSPKDKNTKKTSRRNKHSTNDNHYTGL